MDKDLKAGVDAWSEAPDERLTRNYASADVAHLKQRIVRSELARAEMASKLITDAKNFTAQTQALQNHNEVLNAENFALKRELAVLRDNLLRVSAAASGSNGLASATSLATALSLAGLGLNGEGSAHHVGDGAPGKQHLRSNAGHVDGHGGHGGRSASPQPLFYKIHRPELNSHSSPGYHNMNGGAVDMKARVVSTMASYGLASSTQAGAHGIRSIPASSVQGKGSDPMSAPSSVRSAPAGSTLPLPPLPGSKGDARGQGEGSIPLPNTPFSLSALNAHAFKAPRNAIGSNLSTAGKRPEGVRARRGSSKDRFGSNHPGGMPNSFGQLPGLAPAAGTPMYTGSSALSDPGSLHKQQQHSAAPLTRA